MVDFNVACVQHVECCPEIHLHTVGRIWQHPTSDAVHPKRISRTFLHAVLCQPSPSRLIKEPSVLQAPDRELQSQFSPERTKSQTRAQP